METKRSLAYLRAKKKVETLKGFYSHLIAYIIFNTVIILFATGVISSERLNFSYWLGYTTSFFWGIGLVSHAIYVLFIFKFKNNFLKRWEEKKIKQFLDEDL